MGRSPAAELMKGMIKLSKCSKDIIGEKQIDLKTQICVDVQNNDTDSCSGDSGGGLVIKHKVNNKRRFQLFGIVSYGTGICGISGTVVAYTRVSAFRNWIQCYTVNLQLQTTAGFQKDIKTKRIDKDKGWFDCYVGPDTSTLIPAAAKCTRKYTEPIDRSTPTSINGLTSYTVSALTTSKIYTTEYSTSFTQPPQKQTVHEMITEMIKKLKQFITALFG